MSKFCSQCKAGEKQVEADCKVKGFIYKPYSEKKIPYRANICYNHLYILEEDGAKLDIIESF